MKLKAVLGCIFFWSVSLGHADSKVVDAPNGQNVFIITLDGFRWQELFGGADSSLIHDPTITSDTAYAKAAYWAANKDERRKKLMPFFWNVLAKEGQAFGNRELGSKVNTANMWFLSYPGYNEIFTGGIDPTIATNRKVANDNPNVLEYLNKIPEYKGKVAAIASWDAIPYILNKERSGFYINVGAEPVQESTIPKTGASLSGLQSKIGHTEKATRDDKITYLSAKEYIQKAKPKVLFVGLSGTDDAAHDKKYDQYLKSANDADRIIAGLWNTVQSMPEYKGSTTFIITTDHGRGEDSETWYNHGFFVKGSSQTWMAMMGANVRPLGEVSNESQLYQRSIAGTIGYLLGVKSYNQHRLPSLFFQRDPVSAIAKR